MGDAGSGIARGLHSVWHIDPVPAWILTVGLAALWAAASVHKLGDLAEFTRALSAYELLPRRAVTAVARGLPMLELGVAIGVLLTASRQAAALVGALLLSLYALAIGINLHRGRRQLDCGCLGFGGRRSIAAWLLWRNVGLVLASLAAGVLPRSARTLDWVDLFTVILGAGAAALLYAAVEGLTDLPRPRSREATRDTHA